jgi:hypothetical protein
VLHSLRTYMAETREAFLSVFLTSSECLFDVADRRYVTERAACICHRTAPVKVNNTTVFWVITQRVEVISYRRFGKTYRSHLQGSRIRKEIYHYLLRNNPLKSAALIHFARKPEITHRGLRRRNSDRGET